MKDINPGYIEVPAPEGYDAEIKTYGIPELLLLLGILGYYFWRKRYG